MSETGLQWEDASVCFSVVHVYKQSQNDYMNHLVDQTKSICNFSNLLIISAIFK